MITDARQAFHTLYEAGSVVYVQIDPTTPGVDIPGRLMRAPSATFMYGKHTRVPIPDLVNTRGALTSTLNFNGSPYQCVVPWAAVTQVHDGRTMFYARHTATYAGTNVVPIGSAKRRRPIKRTGLRRIGRRHLRVVR